MDILTKQIAQANCRGEHSFVQILEEIKNEAKQEVVHLREIEAANNIVFFDDDF